MTAILDNLIHALILAVASGFGLAVCIFVALFLAYMIWAAAAESGTERRK